MSAKCQKRTCRRATELFTLPVIPAYLPVPPCVLADSGTHFRPAASIALDLEFDRYVKRRERWFGFGGRRRATLPYGVRD